MVAKAPQPHFVQEAVGDVGSINRRIHAYGYDAASRDAITQQVLAFVRRAPSLL